MVELLTILAVVLVFLGCLLVSDSNRQERADEVVEADSPEEAIRRCSLHYGDEYGIGYVISSVRVEQEPHNPNRWHVWYEATRKGGGPLTSLPLSYVDDVLRSEP